MNRLFENVSANPNNEKWANMIKREGTAKLVAAPSVFFCSLQQVVLSLYNLAFLFSCRGLDLVGDHLDPLIKLVAVVADNLHGSP